jgi:hypothetical protein
MSNRLQIEQMKHRGLAGHYIPTPGGVPRDPILYRPGSGAAIAPPWGLNPDEALTAGPLGRNNTYEEAAGRLLWKRRRTPDGGNHLAPDAAKQPIAVRRAPWLDLTPGGEAYIELNPQEVDIGVLGSVTVVLTFQVPKRKNGNIEWIANQIIGGQGLEGTGLVKWQILLDGVPAKNFQNIPATIGTMSNPADLRESPIRIFENQVVSLVLVNINFNPNQQVLLGMLRGKFWPIEQEGPNTWV